MTNVSPRRPQGADFAKANNGFLKLVMPIKRYKPEQIASLLRQIEVSIANGKPTLQACKEAEIKLDFVPGLYKATFRLVCNAGPAALERLE